jgi:hypothetical protein
MLDIFRHVCLDPSENICNFFKCSNKKIALTKEPVIYHTQSFRDVDILLLVMQ